MQDYNTIIGSIQMRLNGCQTRSVMDRYKIGSGTLNLIMSRYHANGIPIDVPDNLKTAVTKHTKDELILQSTFADLEDFYETGRFHLDY